MEELFMRCLSGMRNAHLGLLSLLLVGCGGSLSFGGNLWPDDDLDDDDDLANDDDLADDDDSSDDDDTDEPPGGPVYCGPTPSPGSSRISEPVKVYTGLTELLFDWVDDGRRGGAFTATWAGCEAVHRFDAKGEYACGILWTATGNSYGEQVMPNGIITRFDMNFTLTENTCGDDPEAQDRSIYFRLSLPFDTPVANLSRSSEPNTLPANMEPWAATSFKSDWPYPELIDLAYFTSFRTDSN